MCFVQGLVSAWCPSASWALGFYVELTSRCSPASFGARSLPECKLLMPLLNQLAGLYPSSKFVSIISDHCIENYPDKNCPTMIIYRKGEMMGQIVGLGAMGGDKVTLRGELASHGLVRGGSKLIPTASRRRAHPLRFPRHRLPPQGRQRSGLLTVFIEIGCGCSFGQRWHGCRAEHQGRGG